MSVYEFYQRKMHINTNSTGKSYPTLGEQLKADSDKLMELTWDNDIQSKRCFIYDYFHDDYVIDEKGNRKILKEDMTYEKTNKTPIDAKFIIKSYQSIDKDRIDYYLQFKPSQKTKFSPDDELYYLEKNYKQKYGSDIFIGCFIDIPDDAGVYHKWIIIEKEIANQFPKYLILPANYELSWIERDSSRRIKRKMWCCLRSQNSYNSGLWTDLRFTSQENQDKFCMPLNSITDKFLYTDDQDKNMRLLVSAQTDHPIAWKISKCENSQPLGIQKLTLYQTFYNQFTDYIEKDSDGNIIGMWADYYDSKIEPVPDVDIRHELSAPIAEISASSYSLKVGGSYKTLTTEITKESSVITSQYSDATFTWSCKIDDEDYTDKVIWREATKFNQIKLKFPPDSSMLGKKIQVECVVEKDDKVIKAKILELQLIE